MRSPRRFRLFAAGVGAAVACAAVPAVASADSASLSVSDPVAGLERLVSFNYHTSEEADLYVRYRPNGGAPCAPTAAGDDGDWLEGQSLPVRVTGAGRLQRALTFPAAGEFQVCFWLARGHFALPSHATSQILIVRKPHGTVTVEIPERVGLNEWADLKVSGSTEVNAGVYSTWRPAGGPACGPTAAGDPGEWFAPLNNVNARGNFHFTERTYMNTPGTYLVCTYLAYDERSLPIATTQTTYTAGAGPAAPTPAPTPGVAKTRVKVTYSCKVGAARVPPGRSTHRRVARGRTLVCSGRTTPARARTQVTVQRMGKRWARTARVRTNAKGAFVYRTPLRAKGRYAYRFVVGASATHRPATSPAVRVAVR